MPASVILPALERALKHDRMVVLIALSSGVVLAWASLLSGIGMDPAAMTMPGMAAAQARPWTASHFGLMCAMWAIMMVAMMLPSAAPMILTFAAIERHRKGATPWSATVIFAAAYVTVWIVFSLAATLLQWQLETTALLSPAMASTSQWLSAVILMAAGVYQFTPLKIACLRGCQSPLDFLSRFWSRGPFGMGWRHGLLCVGCCWMLMLLLFVGGVMNMAWVVLIAAFLLAEKLARGRRWLSNAAGAALVGWGGWVLYTQLAA